MVRITLMVVFRVRIKLMAIFRVSVTVKLMVNLWLGLTVRLTILISYICLHLYVEKKKENGKAATLGYQQQP